jgi:glycosyltransferase involved in cell wall biosynthesis
MLGLIRWPRRAARSTHRSIACTIIARNYLSPARVLHASMSRHHPHLTFVVLLIDDESAELDLRAESFRVLRLSDLGLTRDEIGVLAGIYDPTELATAVKPRLLRRLRGEGHDVVLYLDPDIEVFAPLDEAFAAARAHGLVLTPHTMVPLPRDDCHIRAERILASGVYNLGFVAVGTRCESFLDWWWEQTRREALVDPGRMMFTDQRWVDFAPALFDHALLKHPGYNVAYWNLHGRHLARAGERVTVDGEPLKFFHFSGYDPEKPYLLSKHQLDMPRILLSEHPIVAELCRGYADELRRLGVAETSQRAYGWGRCHADVPMTPALRRYYWHAVVEAEQRGVSPPPGPFGADGPGAFIDWLNEPVVPAIHPAISRFLVDLYRRRPDLQGHFGDLAGLDGARFLQWVLDFGVREESIPLPFHPTVETIERARAPFFAAPDELTAGVTMTGYFHAEAGVGEAVRLMSAALTSAGVPIDTLLYDLTPNRQQHTFELRGRGNAPYDINLICVNADQMTHVRSAFGSGLFDGRYTIGYWFWEAEDFAPAMWRGFELVDEVWTASRFVADAIGRVSPKPVHCLPLPLLPPAVAAGATRATFGIPDGYLFLFTFDYLSVFERKNPCDLVEAFTRAFAPGEGPCLVLKSINGDKRLVDRERLLACIAGRSDIVLIEEYLAAGMKNALLDLCDCYVSLHRSEGLGLTMAETMALGKPVIATGYSGNLQFMTRENSFLVDYRLVPVPAGCAPYAAGTPWAQPDLDEAAALMRQVFLDRDSAALRGQRARTDLLTLHSPAARAPQILARFADIRALRGAAAIVS